MRLCRIFFMKKNILTICLLIASGFTNLVHASDDDSQVDWQTNSDPQTHFNDANDNLEYPEFVPVAYNADSYPYTSNGSLPNDYTGSFWVNLMVGLGYIAGDNSKLAKVDLHHRGANVSIGVSGNYMVSTNRLLTLNGLSEGEIFGGARTSIGALYGLINKNDFGYASITGGISLEMLEPGGLFRVVEAPTTTTIGIPVQGQAFWTPTKSFGLGLIGTITYLPAFHSVAFTPQIGIQGIFNS